MNNKSNDIKWNKIQEIMIVGYFPRDITKTIRWEMSNAIYDISTEGLIIDDRWFSTSPLHWKDIIKQILYLATDIDEIDLDNGLYNLEEYNDIVNNDYETGMNSIDYYWNKYDYLNS